MAIGTRRWMKKTLFSEEHRTLIALLKQARSEAGITQAQLAQSLDVTQSFISKCERGERRLDIVELRAWCRALGVSFPAFALQYDQSIEQQR